MHLLIFLLCIFVNQDNHAYNPILLIIVRKEYPSDCKNHNMSHGMRKYALGLCIHACKSVQSYQNIHCQYEVYAHQFESIS